MCLFSPFGSNKITVQWDHCLVGATFIGHLAYVNLLPESYNFPKPGVNSSQILWINVQEKCRKQYSIADFTGISLTQALSIYAKKLFLCALILQQTCQSHSQTLSKTLMISVCTILGPNCKPAYSPIKHKNIFFGLLSSGYCRSFDSQNDYGLKAISSAQKQLLGCDH